MGVEEAEKYKAEDDANKQKVEAKNGLENYCYSLKGSMDDANLKEKFSEEDKNAMETAVKSALEWLDHNQMAEKEEFESKQKEVEAVANPIMMKVYQAGGAAEGGMGGMPGGEMPAAPGGQGPTVEEVD